MEWQIGLLFMRGTFRQAVMRFYALEIRPLSLKEHTADFHRRYRAHRQSGGKPAARMGGMGICRTCRHQRWDLRRC